MLKSIYFTYHHVEKPWGGANNFMRAFRGTIQETGEFTILDAPSPDCDILFMNQLGRGPAQGSGHYSLNEIKAMRGPKTRLIVRAINLRRHNPGYTLRTFFKNKRQDSKSLTLLHMADHVIFQSQYQKDMFMEYGYEGTSWSIIHNGAAAAFSPGEASSPLDGTLRILSCSFSKGLSKGHSLMARLSQCEGVELHYVGTWPDDVSPADIHLHGVLSAPEIAALLKTVHYFFHPAVQDICPNVVCEALASGLPVIYNPKPGGTIELAVPTGIALTEGNLQAMVRQACEGYEDAARKTRKASPYYTIARALEEYTEVLRLYAR
jgi:hypothetical protein